MTVFIPVRLRYMFFWVQPILIGGSQIAQRTAFYNKVDVPHLSLIQMTQGLYVSYFEDGISKGVGVRSQTDFRLIRISNPGQIRENQYLVQRQRKYSMRTVQPDIRVTIAATPLGSRATSAVVDSNGVI